MSSGLDECGLHSSPPWLVVKRAQSSTLMTKPQLPLPRFTCMGGSAWDDYHLDYSHKRHGLSQQMVDTEP